MNNSHITLTEIFKPEIVDYDSIVPNKMFFNVYNNSLDEPFHKFWFYIENAKLINNFDDNILRFALNHKNEKIKKIITYLKNLFDYIQSLFKKMYEDITIEIPWKEYDNYPYLMNFSIHKNTICMDTKQENKNITEITKEQNCSILFELTYIQIIKIMVNNKPNYSLKFKFNLIMVQEKTVDIRTSLLENINQITNPKIKTTHYTMASIPNNSPTETHKPIPSTPPAVRMSLDPNILLSKMKSLNKVDKVEKKEKDCKEQEDDKNIPEYLEKKNKLKKVEIEEKSLLPILKKEHEDMINLQKQEIKNIINNEIAELDELDELEKLDLKMKK
jgi:hypothetical protein